jgi:hypothetical protein
MENQIMYDPYENNVRWLARENGYKIMHRRGEQYWFMLDAPLTLHAINFLLNYQKNGKNPAVALREVCGIFTFRRAPKNSGEMSG